MRWRWSEPWGSPSSFRLNSLNSTDLAPGNRSVKVQTTAVSITPFSSSASALSNSIARSSVTRNVVSLSLACSSSSSMV